MHALREKLLGHGNGYLIKDEYEREVKQLEVKKIQFVLDGLSYGRLAPVAANSNKWCLL